MHRRHRNSLALLLVTSIFASSLQHAAYAGVISTQEYLTAIDRDAALNRIDTVLAREEVRRQLEQRVDPLVVTERIAALTDQELQLLATDLESLQAGGDLLAVVGIAFVVLLILELVGVIDIFNKI
jgi:uncharacterized membrane protein (Fun14 family)